VGVGVTECAFSYPRLVRDVVPRMAPAMAVAPRSPMLFRSSLGVGWGGGGVSAALTNAERRVLGTHHGSSGEQSRQAGPRTPIGSGWGDGAGQTPPRWPLRHAGPHGTACGLVAPRHASDPRPQHRVALATDPTPTHTCETSPSTHRHTTAGRMVAAAHVPQTGQELQARESPREGLGTPGSQRVAAQTGASGNNTRSGQERSKGYQGVGGCNACVGVSRGQSPHDAGAHLSVDREGRRSRWSDTTATPSKPSPHRSNLFKRTPTPTTAPTHSDAHTATHTPVPEHGALCATNASTISAST
jgi:hypothetical protein